MTVRYSLLLLEIYDGRPWSEKALYIFYADLLIGKWHY
jgi:hypothetical protein